MRVPLAQNLMSRDGTLAKNALMTNALAEVKGEQAIAFKRPGVDLQMDLIAGIGQGAVCWKNTLYTVSGNIITQGPTANPWPDGSAWTVLNGGSPVISVDTTSAVQCTFKHPTDGYTYALVTESADTSYFYFYRTTDGLSWTQYKGPLRVADYPAGYSSPGGATQIRFAYDDINDKWYMVLGFINTAANSVWASTDGMNTWTRLTNSPFGAYPRGYGFDLIIKNGTLYVFGGQGDATLRDDVHSSSNGTSWTRIVADMGLPGYNRFQSVKAGAEGRRYWVGFSDQSGSAVSKEIWASGVNEDVTTWSKVSDGTALPNTGMFGAAYSEGGTMVAVYLTAQTAVYSSSDLGATWALATSNYGGVSPYRLVGIGSSIFTFTSNGSQTLSYKATNNQSSDATYTPSPSLNSEQIDFTNTGGAAATEYLFLKTSAEAYVLTFGDPGTLTNITDADYPATTVPGAVYLDGYICVMDPEGTIYNCDLEAPTAWNSLNFIRAELEPDFGVALAKHQNYLVAFKTKGMEFFYDAAQTNGSPFLRLPSASLRIGCAHGRSIASVDGGLFWLSRTSSAAATVHWLPDASLTPQEVATEDVKRVLEQADLTDVSAWAARIGGHSLYALNLKSEGLTLVYDRTSGFWQRFTLRTAAGAKSVSALAQANGIATATATAHGFADGDPITIAGASPSGYNGTFNVNVVDANTFTYYVSSALAGTATGTITATGTTEGYFPFSNFVACGGRNYVQHDTQADLYEIGPQYLNDEGAPIDMRIRTAKVDADAILPKTLAELAIIGEEATGILLARYSDDDYTTFSRYRQINLAQRKPALRGLGRFRRRVFEFRYTGNGLPRMTEAELTLGG